MQRDRYQVRSDTGMRTSSSSTASGRSLIPGVVSCVPEFCRPSSRIRIWLCRGSGSYSMPLRPQVSSLFKHLIVCTVSGSPGGPKMPSTLTVHFLPSSANSQSTSRRVPRDTKLSPWRFVLRSRTGCQKMQGLERPFLKPSETILAQTSFSHNAAASRMPYREVCPPYRLRFRVYACILQEVLRTAISRQLPTNAPS